MSLDGPYGGVRKKLAIDKAMKSTEEKFGITIRAIQDDMTLLGDAKVIFGTNGNNGALEFLLSALEEVGLVPNRSKFKIFAVDDDEETLGFIPDWLRTPDTRPQVKTEGEVVWHTARTSWRTYRPRVL